MKLLIACVCCVGCGFEPITPVHEYNISMAGVTEDGINTVRDIVFEIAQHELSDVAKKVEDYGYVINVLPYSAKDATEDCGADNDLGCTHTKTKYEVQGSVIYAFGQDDCDAYAVLAHEFIHYSGYPYGRYLGCPTPDTKWIDNDHCHNPPYFEMGATNDTQRQSTWEWCAVGRAMAALCPNMPGGYTEAQMAECDY